MTSAERAALPGIDARRADLLPAGALLVTTVLDLTGLDELVGLRVGPARRHGARRHRSPQPGRVDRRPPGHAAGVGARPCAGAAAGTRRTPTKVARLAGGAVRRHLAAARPRATTGSCSSSAALLHDIGEHVSKEGHERHTAYLIENGRLRGFSPDEVAVLACLGRFHKRGTPKLSFEPYAALRPADRNGSPSWSPCSRSPTASTAATAARSATSRCITTPRGRGRGRGRRRHRPRAVGPAAEARVVRAGLRVPARRRRCPNGAGPRGGLGDPGGQPVMILDRLAAVVPGP